MKEDQVKHLEFVQGVITRMNANSFSIKTWAVTLVAAFMAMYASGDNHNHWYFIAAIVPTIICWCLDTYYLRMERAYRKLYEEVLKGETINFEMKLKKQHKECFFAVLFRLSEIGLYLPIIVCLLVAFFLL